MGKKAVRKPSNVHVTETWVPLFRAFAVIVMGIAAASYHGSKLWGSPDAQAATEATGAEPRSSPSTMQATQPLVTRLLQLLEEIEKFKDDDHKAERRTASARLEKELDDIEATLGKDKDNSADKQSAALISVVRSALQADRDGWKDEDWNDEKLVEQHGFVTYASQTYWDEAYADNRYGDSYDWYGAWAEKGAAGSSIGDVVRPLLAKNAKILMLGSGNSNMSVLMHEEGYRDITNVDISEPVIAQMKKSYGHIEGLSWHSMDASALAVGDGVFDAVIEKGLFDALFAGTGALTEKVLAEVRRILRPGGSLVSITFSGERLRALLKPGAGAGEADGLSCAEKGQIKYDKAKNAHKGEGQTFHIYRCDKP